MGICIDYTLCCEVSEDELIQRLHRLAEQAVTLPGVSLYGELERYEPVFDTTLLSQMMKENLPIPQAVHDRAADFLEELAGDYNPKTHGRNMFYLAMLLCDQLSDDIKQRVGQMYQQNPRDDQWNPEDYPEKIQIGFNLTYFREGIRRLIVDTLYCRGYSLVIDPGAGAEAVQIQLGGHDVEPVENLWYGASFCKTQYAEDFMQTHENVCRILDFAQDLGLLVSASDGCEFYEHRDWKRSAPIVTESSIAIRAVSDMLKAGAEQANKAGITVETISDPIRRSMNLITVKDDDEEEEDKEGAR